MRPEDVVNLEQYPIADRESPARAALISRLSSELASLQYCSLPDFIRPDALERTVSDTISARREAYEQQFQTQLLSAPRERSRIDRRPSAQHDVRVEYAHDRL